MIMVGRDSRREARKMAVRVSATSGFDLGYVWRNLGGEPERTAGGYYINAAQAGEAPGRWFGAGAEAAGLAEGSVVDRDVYDQVYNQVSPLTGQKMGRAPGGYAKFADHLARLEAAEPHATWERRLELERIAVQQTRRSPAYTDVLVSFDKTISIVHASIWENERRARLAGDEAAAALWRDREARWSEVLQDANVRGLRYLHEQGSFTRTGYHGRRVEGVEPGRWERALPFVTSWLQGTTRAESPHDHVHNQHARVALTESEGRAARWPLSDPGITGLTGVALLLSSSLGTIGQGRSSCPDCEEYGAASAEVRNGSRCDDSGGCCTSRWFDRKAIRDREPADHVRSRRRERHRPDHAVGFACPCRASSRGWRLRPPRSGQHQRHVG